MFLTQRLYLCSVHKQTNHSGFVDQLGGLVSLVNSQSDPRLWGTFFYMTHSSHRTSCSSRTLCLLNKWLEQHGNVKLVWEEEAAAQTRSTVTRDILRRLRVMKQELLAGKKSTWWCYVSCFVWKQPQFEQLCYSLVEIKLTETLMSIKKDI